MFLHYWIKSFVSGLIFCWTAICIYDCLNSSWHAFDNSFNFILRDQPPSFFHKLFKLIKIFRFFFSFLRLYLISFHRFSIRLRSGIWAGPESIWRDFSSWNSMAILLRCGGALSSWNHPSPCGKKRFIVGRTCFWIISRYTGPVTEPARGTIGPSPCAEKHPQNIRLGLCFTSHWDTIRWPFFRHFTPYSASSSLLKLSKCWFVTPKHLCPIFCCLTCMPSWPHELFVHIVRWNEWFTMSNTIFKSYWVKCMSNGWDRDFLSIFLFPKILNIPSTFLMIIFISH